MVLMLATGGAQYMNINREILNQLRFMMWVTPPFTPLGSNPGVNSYFQHHKSEPQNWRPRGLLPSPSLLMTEACGSCMSLDFGGTETCSCWINVFDKWLSCYSSTRRQEGGYQVSLYQTCQYLRVRLFAFPWSYSREVWGQWEKHLWGA